MKIGAVTVPAIFRIERGADRIGARANYKFLARRARVHGDHERRAVLRAGLARVIRVIDRARGRDSRPRWIILRAAGGNRERECLRIRLRGRSTVCDHDREIGSAGCAGCARNQAAGLREREAAGQRARADAPGIRRRPARGRERGRIGAAHAAARQRRSRNRQSTACRCNRDAERLRDDGRSSCAIGALQREIGRAKHRGNTADDTR